MFMDQNFYDGMVGIINANAGNVPRMTQGYKEMKSKFRYPGEVLERMAEQGYTSEGCYTAALMALAENPSLVDEQMFVGNQLQDFLQVCENLSCAKGSFHVAACMYLYTKEEKYFQQAVGVIRQKTDLEAFALLSEIGDSPYIDVPWTEAFMIGHPNLPGQLHQFKPANYRESYDVLIRSSLQRKQASPQRKYDIGKEWRNLLSAMLPLRDSHVKQDTPKAKKLMSYGYTYKDILDMNMQAFRWAKETSPVKYYRMVREWVEETLCSPDELPPDALATMANLATKKMPRKIDGTDNPTYFLFLSCRQAVTDPERAAFLVSKCLTEKAVPADAMAPCFGKFSMRNAGFVQEVRNLLQEPERDIPVWAALYRDWRKLDGKQENEAAFIHEVDQFGQMLGIEMRRFLTIGKSYPVRACEFYDTFFRQEYIDVLEALESNGFPATAAKSFLSGFEDHAAYDALVRFWEKIKGQAEIPHDTKHLIPRFILKGVAPEASLTEAELRDTVYIALYLMFRGSDYHTSWREDKHYEQLLFTVLTSDVLRKAFTAEELRMVYSTIQKDAGRYYLERERLKPILLSKEEFEEEQKQKEIDKQKEKEAKQEAEQQRATTQLFADAGKAVGRNIPVGETIPLEGLLMTVPHGYFLSDSEIQAWTKELRGTMEFPGEVQMPKDPYALSMQALYKLYQNGKISRELIRIIDNRITVTGEA